MGVGAGIQSCYDPLARFDVDGSQVGRGFGYYALAGVDLILLNHELDTGETWFLRVEMLHGNIPDWELKLFPEIRPIKRGSYDLFRLGVGITLDREAAARAGLPAILRTMGEVLGNL